jgi:hypothetical protein
MRNHTWNFFVSSTLSETTQQPRVLRDFTKSTLSDDCFDMIHRVVIDTSSKKFAVKSWNTRDFEAALCIRDWHYHRDIQALKLVTNWQRKYINYQAVYSAYLIGALTEEEFAADSEEFISESKSVAPETIAPLIVRFNALLDFKLNDNEIAEYLEVDYESVSQAMDLISSSDLDDLMNDNNHPALRLSV